MPLSYGELRGCDLQCCYHGWTFDTGTGVCTDIPSMSADQDRNRLRGIRVATYPVQETQGHVWIFMPGDSPARPETVPPVPVVPDFASDVAPKISRSMRVTCPVDQVVIGLMDPAHQVFVHNSWWMSHREFMGRTVEKRYAPAPWGYQLIPNQQEKNALLYRLLGSRLENTFRFQLPTLRVEHTRGANEVVGQLAAITPLTDRDCELHVSFFWRSRWLDLLRPVANRMLARFMKQDHDVMLRQQEGLDHDPNTMLIGDADAQAKWYFKLKEEYQRSRRDNREFANPLQVETLRWRS
jgi:phenylpropionate dioxygenase-like ring-hydroxylating dioxygenase large terminal subunit